MRSCRTGARDQCTSPLGAVAVSQVPRERRADPLLLDNKCHLSNASGHQKPTKKQTQKSSSKLFDRRPRCWYGFQGAISPRKGFHFRTKRRKRSLWGISSLQFCAPSQPREEVLEEIPQLRGKGRVIREVRAPRVFVDPSTQEHRITQVHVKVLRGSPGFLS